MCDGRECECGCTLLNKCVDMGWLVYPDETHLKFDSLGSWNGPVNMCLFRVANLKLLSVDKLVDTDWYTTEEGKCLKEYWSSKLKECVEMLQAQGFLS